MHYEWRKRLRQISDNPTVGLNLIAKQTLSVRRPGFGQLIGKMGSRPDFLIIGTQKGGTTSLYSYLASHPKVGAAVTKEVHYFDFHYGCGDRWYSAHFPPAAWLSARHSYTGEASPGYLFNPYAAARVAAFVPSVKLIVMLRNPVTRAISHYHMSLRRGREQQPFEKAIELEPSRLTEERERMGPEAAFARGQSHRNHSYLARGHYADQLMGWLEHFPREQLMVVESEQFFANPREVHAETMRFLKLPHRPLRQYRNCNGWGRSGVVPALHETLEAYFEPHNARLEQLLGRRMWERP